MRRLASALLAALALSGVWALAASTPAIADSDHDGRSNQRYFAYWDFNEQENYLSSPSGRQGALVPPYDPNGQMCLFPDGSGRFVTGYNPTLPSQHNPGSLKPVMQPPVGEAVWNRDGTFSGKTIFVPGPYELPGQTVGGDIPPDQGSGTFNNNGTFTGCAFDRHGNLFGSDLGTAQGQFPSPDDGRVIEWFGPDYNAYCIVDGPTTGGVGPHHVDGTGGLAQPGDLAFDDHGNLMVPEAGATQNGLPGGRVLRFDHSSLPDSASDCGSDGLLPTAKLSVSVFIQGSFTDLPFPQGIALDPVCDCFAVGSVFGDPAIAFFDEQGHPLTSPAAVPGEPIAELGSNPNGYNPFGLAFAPDGTLYFVDIHIVCSAPLVNCGPGSKEGRLMKVTFTNGQPSTPSPVATGLDFPTSVTVCVPDRQTCPRPHGHSHHDDD